jgi:hypothetical protein
MLTSQDQVGDGRHDVLSNSTRYLRACSIT